MSLRRTLVAGACAVALAASAPSVAGVGYDYVYNPTPLTFSGAKAHCESLGGHLTSIGSTAEEATVKAAVPTSPAVIWFWVGGTDEGSEGTWRWLDGTPFTYTHWGGGEPNNVNGGENYLATNSWNMYWNDATNNNVGGSNNALPSVCKVKKNGHYCYPRDCCTEFQQFIDGEGQAIQPVAPGTVCKNGGLVWPSECTTSCSTGAAVVAPPSDTYTGLRCVPADCCREYRWVVNGVQYAPQPTAPGTVCKTQADGTARMVMQADCGSICPLDQIQFQTARSL